MDNINDFLTMKKMGNFRDILWTFSDTFKGLRGPRVRNAYVPFSLHYKCTGWGLGKRTLDVSISSSTANILSECAIDYVSRPVQRDGRT